MQKNARFFTFQFTFRSRDKIKVRRFQVSRRLIQTGSISIFTIAIITTLGTGVHGLLSNAAFANNFGNSYLMAQAAPFARMDYSRPGTSAAMAVNAGGPIDVTDTAAVETDVESVLAQIQRSSSPDNIPNVWAHAGKINNEFGFRRNPFGGRTYEFHAGMDIDGERGDIVVAPAAGIVTKAGWQGGYGNMIEVDHGNGLITRYGHLSKLNVELGDTITRGQLIGFVGSTGRSTGPHLHYELRLNDHPINPRRFLPPETTDIQKAE